MLNPRVCCLRRAANLLGGHSVVVHCFAQEGTNHLSVSLRLDPSNKLTCRWVSISTKIKLGHVSVPACCSKLTETGTNFKQLKIYGIHIIAIKHLLTRGDLFEVARIYQSFGARYLRVALNLFF
jgi:hypothetical protein